MRTLIGVKCTFLGSGVKRPKSSLVYEVGACWPLVAGVDKRPARRHGHGHPVVTENSVRSKNKEVPINREIMVANTMSSLFVALFALVASSFRTHAALQAEILALRHQLAILQKNAPRRLRFHRRDRFLWVVLSRFWSGWRRCLQMVQPDTVRRRHH